MISKTAQLQTPPSEEPSSAPVGMPPPPPAPRRHVPWVRWVVLAVIAVVCYVGYPWAKPYAEAYWPRVKELADQLRGARGAGATPAKGGRIVPVVTAEVRKADVPMYLNGLGSVTAFYTVAIHSRVDGELMKVSFTEGQMVKQGDLLAEIDPRPFQVQLEQAQGQLTKDQAALKIALLDLDRYTTLLTSKAVTQQQVDAQRALVQQSEGAIQTDQGMINNAKLQITYCRITSPINGRIGLRLVDPGNIIHASDPNGLAVITQLQPIALVFTIPQDEIWRVQQRFKDGGNLEVEAFDRELKTRLATGKLLAIDNQVDVTTGTVRLKAIFENEENLLFPNQFVNARLLVDTAHDAIVVPPAAVQRGPNSAFVYVPKETGDKTPQGKPIMAVKRRDVSVGQTEGDMTIILEGLQPGELVVTDGVDKLVDDTKVEQRGTRAPGKSGVQEAPAPTGNKGKP